MNVCTAVCIPNSTAEFSILYANVTELTDVAQLAILAMSEQVRIVAETHLNLEQSKGFIRSAEIADQNATASPARDTNKYGHDSGGMAMMIEKGVRTTFYEVDNSAISHHHRMTGAEVRIKGVTIMIVGLYLWHTE